MSLEEQVKNIVRNFDGTASDEIVEVLNKIRPLFKSDLTSEYLAGKLQKIADIGDDSEKKKQCRSLIPYLDWYLQGL